MHFKVSNKRDSPLYNLQITLITIANRKGIYRLSTAQAPKEPKFSLSSSHVGPAQAVFASTSFPHCTGAIFSLVVLVKKNLVHQLLKTEICQKNCQRCADEQFSFDEENLSRNTCLSLRCFRVEHLA